MVVDAANPLLNNPPTKLQGDLFDDFSRPVPGGGR